MEKEMLETFQRASYSAFELASEVTSQSAKLANVARLQAHYRTVYLGEIVEELSKVADFSLDERLTHALSPGAWRRCDLPVRCDIPLFSFYG